MMYRSLERSPQDPRDGIFCTVPRPHFLDRVLIWPGCFGEHILGLFGLYPSSLSKSVRFVSLSENASLVSISAAILFLRSWHVYFPLEFRRVLFRSRARSTRGQENEAWALYKKFHPGSPEVSFLWTDTSDRKSVV